MYHRIFQISFESSCYCKLYWSYAKMRSICTTRKGWRASASFHSSLPLNNMWTVCVFICLSLPRNKSDSKPLSVGTHPELAFVYEAFCYVSWRKFRSIKIIDNNNNKMSPPLCLSLSLSYNHSLSSSRCVLVARRGNACTKKCHVVYYTLIHLPFGHIVRVFMSAVDWMEWLWEIGFLNSMWRAADAIDVFEFVVVLIGELISLSLFVFFSSVSSTSIRA